jgi:trehalose/maltose hydrolase-like predicted phosphorylase
VAADEWAENVDNNAFTNAAARANLRNAVEAAKILGFIPDADWTTVANNIPILKLNDGVTSEHASYRGEGIKQADVNLLAYPLKEITDPKQIAKDLAYYETRVPNEGTPAMTQAIFALLYARLGDGDKALHFFKDGYLPNLLPPFRVIAETKGGTNPYFATGAGGLVQSILMGFGGLEIT